MSHQDATVVLQPSPEPLDLPAAAVTTQRPSILGRRLGAVLSLRRNRNQLDPAFGLADRANRCCMPSRQSGAADRVPETVCPRSTRPTLPSTARRWPLPQPTETRGHLPSPSPWNPCPVWFCRPRRPLFAGANIASINASARSNYPPCVRPCSASVRTIFCHAPSRTQR
jgi:hypothetical protein